MMKKLLVLTLVFGMAAMANATLDWVVTGSTAGTGIPTDVMANDVLTLSLVLSGDTASAIKIDLITDNGALGGITDVDVTAAFPNGQDGMDAFTFDNDLLGGMLGLDAGDWAWLDRFSTTGAVGGTLLTVYYTVGAEADGTVITINGEGIEILESNNYVAALDGGFLTPPVLDLIVIPEPMTLALLGLGGLFLRRRK